jgi:co-chaperonin GroES (HSP10)
MNVFPIKNKVMLKRNTVPSVTEMGIIVDTSLHQYFDNWIVEAVGPEVTLVKVGDIVYVDRDKIHSSTSTPASGILTKVKNDIAWFVHEDEIMAVLDN